MKVYLIKKEKHRIYKSEAMVLAICGKDLLHNEEGAPVVDGAFISITDNKDYWACALSDHSVGIDLESINRTVTPSIVNRLHKNEAQYLNALSFGSDEWREEFFAIWTKKESYSKKLGKGLALGYKSFSVLDNNELYSKKYKGLIISATEDFEIENFRFDAPMEKSALEAGADILDMFGCSSAKLKTKLLERGYSEEDAQSAVDCLNERGYLNDDEYCRSLCQKYEARNYASKRIELELKQKGVSKELAKNWAEKYKSSDYERAQRQTEKLISGKDVDDKLKAKIARKLASLGYDTYIIYDIIKK